MDILYTNLLAFDRYDLIMIAIGCVLVYLAIAKEIIELHDGSITVGSKDESICFTVTLPRLQDTHISK